MKRVRARAVDIPDWWLRLANEAVARRNVSQAHLAAELSRVAKRERPWNQSTISVFLSGQKTTEDVADAIRAYFSLPPPVIYPESEAEAILMDAVRLAFRRLPRR